MIGVELNGDECDHTYSEKEKKPFPIARDAGFEDVGGNVNWRGGYRKEQIGSPFFLSL
jgi:hypothetical protein